MKLAKDCIDIDVRTNQVEPMLDFRTKEIGLTHELLKTGSDARQHRLVLNGSSIFKLNCHREEISDTPTSGYKELYIAGDADQPHSRNDPGRNLVTLLPYGWQDITRTDMRMTVRSFRDSTEFFEKVLSADPLSENRFRWATTISVLDEQHDQVLSVGLQGLGYRYTTVQAFKTDSEHHGLLDRGARGGPAPLTLGTTARISFITDPGINWIEISQRASLTVDLVPG